MKKLMLSLALLTICVGGTSAQGTAEKQGSWKAYDITVKANSLSQQETPEAMSEAAKLYAEAESIIKNDIEEAKVKEKYSKVALLYVQNAELQNYKLLPMFSKIQKNEAFDTLAFCQGVENIVDSYNVAADFNSKPNSKGKVKADKNLVAKCSDGLKSVAMYYYYCGMFKANQGDKKACADYYLKFAQLPYNSVALTEADKNALLESNKKTYAEARYFAAYNYYGAKAWKEAIAACDEALKDTVGVKDLFAIKCSAYSELKDTTSWEKTLVEAAERTGDSNYYKSLIAIMIEQKNVEKAKSWAQKLIQKDPNNKLNWYLQGTIVLGFNEFDEARKSFEKALALDPNYPDALYYMGIAYYNDITNQIQSGKFQFIGTNKAVTKKNQALYDKELAEVMSYFEKAKGYLEHLREVTPDNPKQWASALQMVYSSMNLEDKAKEMDRLIEESNRAN